MNAKPVTAFRTPLKLFLFVFFCAFLWLLNSDVLAKEATAPAAKKPTGPARFETEIAAFEKWDHQNAVPQNCILFVGSSTIRLWQTADAFADRIVFKYKPRTIVFYAGDNDIAGGHSPDKVFANYESFAKSVHERLPDTKLIYLAIKPSPLRWKMWPQSQTVNSRVKE